MIYKFIGPKHPLIYISLKESTLKAEVHPKIVETLKKEPYNTIYWYCMEKFCKFTQTILKTHNID